MLNFHIKIWHKLFFTILLVIVLILAINVWLSRLHFQQGFSQYIEEIKQRRLDRFSQSLADHYQQHGSWGFINDDPLRWHQMLHDADLAPPPPPRIEGAETNDPSPVPKTDRFTDFGPPALPPPSWHPPPPGRHPSPADADDFSPPGFPPPGRHPPPPPLMWERIGLLDQQHKRLFGPPPVGPHRLLSIELQAEIIGYLVVDAFKTPYSQVDAKFANDQLKDLLLTALVSFIVAVIAALSLARLFNRPLTRLIEMARRLTLGRFDSRLEINSQDELGGLAVDLNNLAETLEQNQDVRRQWIADISHELRTPLTVLIGELEAIEDGVRPLNAESMQSFSLEVKQLQRLVGDLYQLSLSDLGSLSYEMEPVAAFELLRGILDGFENAIQQKQITLTVGCDGDEPPIIADAHRLTQLFTNLLENSLRYTNAGGEIKVTCEIGTTLDIHIEDSAPGVQEELIPHIFERLFRVNRSRSRRHGGSGLGLSIVQSIAKAHGGELKAQSSDLGGLKISLQLPIKSEIPQ